MPLPSRSPILVPVAICFECGTDMKPDVEKSTRGTVIGVVLECTKCNYQHRVSMQHVTGESFIPKKKDK